MKIVQAISHYIPAIRFGGPLQMAHSLGKALIEAGHEVTVCTTNMETRITDLDVPIDVPVEIDGVRVYYERVRFSRYWGYSPGLMRRAVRELKSADLLISHFHFQFASVAGGMAARRQKKPFIVLAHGSLRHSAFNAHGGIRKLWYIYAFERINFTRALFVGYHSLDEIVHSFHFGRSELVGIGIDRQLVESQVRYPPLAERYPETRGRFVFVYMGRIARNKGLDLIVSAFASVLQKHDCHLLIIGGDEGGYKSTLEKMIAAAGIKNWVTFTGVLTGDDKYASLAGSDVFVLPSRSEGISIATLEAMAIARPVIVSDQVGVSADIREANAGIVVAYSEKSVAAAMERMIANGARIEMGLRGRTCVRERYCMDQMVKRLTGQIEFELKGT